MGYSPRGRKEADTTERLPIPFHEPLESFRKKGSGHRDTHRDSHMRTRGGEGRPRAQQRGLGRNQACPHLALSSSLQDCGRVNVRRFTYTVCAVICYDRSGRLTHTYCHLLQ